MKTGQSVAQIAWEEIKPGLGLNLRADLCNRAFDFMFLIMECDEKGDCVYYSYYCWFCWF